MRLGTTTTTTTTTRSLLLCLFTRDLDAFGESATAGIAVRDAGGVKGLGAFALRSFAEGETVGDYEGEILSRREADARYYGGPATWRDRIWKSTHASHTGNYLFEVEPDVVVDAEDATKANWCRYINHSNEPNLRVKSLPEAYGGRPRVWFVALRTISVGEELCFDYGDRYWREDELPS
ncbi:hypothetical protein CTAYLR_004942 [Chrysophaeum taylorii]|uniref:SET domain-containing protein n=1 Tax=Chrysophaeum taylorii TaxID=2483200 RepID=A0AAD7UR61_9STRA|nr:hypothetical protein CTAYLR_004942 [Chrysophaeum taylorii]